MPPCLFYWYLTGCDKATGFFQLSLGSKAVWGFVKPVILFSKIQSPPGYSGPCKRTNLVIIRKSGFRSSVRATKWQLSDVCNSLTRSEIMLMWLKVPRWLCFRGTVMKNLLQSLENSGSSFWGKDTPFNPLNIWLVFPIWSYPWWCLEAIIMHFVCRRQHATSKWQQNTGTLNKCVTGKDNDHLTIQPPLWRQHVFLECRKKQVNKLNTHVSLCSSSYRHTDACHNIAEWEDRHVLGSIHPTHTQPLRSNPFDHCDVVLTVETVVGYCKQIYQQDQYTVRQAFESDLFSKLSGGFSSVVRELPSTVTTESLTVGLTWAIWAETAQTCRYVHI